jgi:hypothetical protein
MIIIPSPTLMLIIAILCIKDENDCSPGLLILFDINKGKFKLFFNLLYFVQINF